MQTRVCLTMKTCVARRLADYECLERLDADVFPTFRFAVEDESAKYIQHQAGFMQHSLGQRMKILQRQRAKEPKQASGEYEHHMSRTGGRLPNRRMIS